MPMDFIQKCCFLFKNFKRDDIIVQQVTQKYLL